MLLHILHQLLERSPVLGGRRDIRALEVEGGHADVPASVLFADEIFHGDADVVEDNLVEDVFIGHVYERADADAGRVHRGDEVRDAFVFRGFRIGAGEEEAPVGLVSVRGPDLRPVDDVVVAVLDSAGLEGGEVGAGVGF